MALESTHYELIARRNQKVVISSTILFIIAAVWHKNQIA